MRPHETDFVSMLPYLGDWQELDDAARWAWIRCRPGQPVSAATLGTEPEPLVAAGLLEHRAAGGLEAPRDTRALHVFLRMADRRRRILDPARAVRAMRAYVQEALDPDDRNAIYGHGRMYHDDTAGLLAKRVLSCTWVESYLDAESPEDWEGARWNSSRRGRGPARPLLLPATGRALTACLAELRDRGGRSSLTDLFADAKGRDRSDRARALRAGLHYLLLFPHLDPEDLLPAVALAPGVAARLTRTPAAPPVVSAQAVEAPSAFLLADMTAVLVRAAADDLRRKSNGIDLYERSKAALLASLAPLDPFVAEWADTDDDRRIEDALSALTELKFVRDKTDQGGRVTVRPTPAGRAWLAEPPRRRRQRVLDLYRPAEGPQDFPCRLFASHGRTAVLAPAVRARRTLEVADDEVLLSELRVALSALPSTGSVDLHAWLRHRAEAENPLVGTGRTQSAMRRHVEHWRWEGPEELERIWRAVLASAITRRLIPLGGVGLARPSDAGDAPHVALTAAGRYLVGAADELDAEDTTTQEARVVVQPNFEVVFLAPAPHHDAQLAPVAERVGEHVGTLYRLTRESVQRAAAAGLGVDDVLDRLTQANDGPLPPNVERSIRGWHGRLRRAHVERPWVVRCPDEETADRVESAAGASAERLGPTTLAVSSRAKLVRLRQRLVKEDVHLDLDAPRRRRP